MAAADSPERVEKALEQLDQQVGGRRPASRRPIAKGTPLDEVERVLDELLSGDRVPQAPAVPAEAVQQADPDRAIQRASPESGPSDSAAPDPHLASGLPQTPSDVAELEKEDAFFAALSVGDGQDGEASVQPATASSSPPTHSNAIPSVVPPAPPPPDQEAKTQPLTQTGAWRVSQEAIRQKPTQQEAPVQAPVPEEATEVGATLQQLEGDVQGEREDNTDVFPLPDQAAEQRAAVAGDLAEDSDEIEMLMDDEIEFLEEVEEAPPRSTPPEDDKADDLIDSLFEEDS